ncbi:hypothetical protein MKEN_00009200 [Mycena kentingensis (nom. inval.)]|nr:hypothetical protein MKEN_00009200 [Mycena kentingensis (nom. inval.)]
MTLNLKSITARRRAAAAAQATNNPPNNSNSEDPPELPASSSPATRSSSPSPDNFNEDPLPSVTQVISSGLTANRVPDMTAFGERQLKRVKLSADSEREYRNICATTNVHERNNLESLAVFKLADKVDEMIGLMRASKMQDFEKSSELTGEVRKFTRGFLINPNLRFYSADSTLKLTVIDAMYKEKIPGLPPADSSNAVRKKLESLVGHQLSVDRNRMKELLSATLDADQDEFTTDIASVTTTLISSWGLEVPLTLQVLWRMALIRRSLQDRDTETTSENFWDSLDKCIEDCRAEEAGSLAIALQEVFKEDLQSFGAIPTTIEFQSDIGPHSLPWLQRVNKMASTVDHPKITNPKGKGKGKRVPQKRKREEAEDEGNVDGNGDDNN